MKVKYMKSISLYNNDFLTIKTGSSALAESVERILLTSPGERVNNPLFGCMLKQSLFNFDSYLTEDITINITNAINRWEPRVLVKGVSIIKKDTNSFEILVEVINNETGLSFTVQTILNT